MPSQKPPCAVGSARAARACLLLAFAMTSFGCTVLRRPLALPPRATPYVAVLSGEMPEPITLVARHGWIVANLPDHKALLRYEYLGGASQRSTMTPYHHFGTGDVALHGVLRGSQAEIAKIVACLDVETPRYNVEHPTYFPIPGPNSNTYVDQMLRRCDIPFDLPATAIGRDYRGVIGASVTSGGTGVQLETWPFGIKLGLKEGIELRLLGLTLGIDFWPPALIVPVNPGRLGFDDR